MNLPKKLIAIDYETALTTGQPSAQYWRPDFRVTSCAFTRSVAGKLQSIFVIGEERVHRILKRLVAADYHFIVFNLQFEQGVTQQRFPDLAPKWYADTQRLAQLYDNGQVQATGARDDEDFIDETLADKGPVGAGFSLVACTSRILPEEFHNHKAEATNWLKTNLPEVKGKLGLNLDKLPIDVLRRYNIGDTENTYRLYDTITKQFTQEGYDWLPDHELYKSSVKLIISSFIEGVRVDREKVQAYIGELDLEIDSINGRFLETFKPQIADIEKSRMLAKLQGYKAKHFIEKCQMRLDQGVVDEDCRFNPGSTKQLTELFVGKLGLQPVFWTKESKVTAAKRRKNPRMLPFEPKPSFQQAHLNQWGDGGKILKGKKKRELVRSQCQTLYDFSAYDGRWHLETRAVGTATGRQAGSGGLNVQGLARRDRGLMSALIPPPGYVFVSIDQSAGEPTTTASFSGDPYYTHATYSGAGKRPYYDNREILLIDDVYLMVASVSPIGKIPILKAFSKLYDGRSFAVQWLTDPEVIKKELEDLRKLHKVIVLALMYGMGPKKMLDYCYDKGIHLTTAQAKAFYIAFWKLFTQVKGFAQTIEKQLEREGYLVNPLGYRNTCEAHKGFNAFNQSTVSGLMNYFNLLLFERATYAKYVVVIHDEVIAAVPVDKLEQFKQDRDLALQELNNELQWTIPIRVGWAVGNNLFEAK